MDEVNWAAPTEVQVREDDGSDMYINFRTLRSGGLAEMVRWVRDLTGDERARVIADVRGRGSLNIHDLDALARRPDFPTA